MNARRREQGGGGGGGGEERERERGMERCVGVYIVHLASLRGCWRLSRRWEQVGL